MNTHNLLTVQSDPLFYTETYLYLALVLLLLSKDLFLILLFHQLKEMKPPALFEKENTVTMWSAF